MIFYLLSLGIESPWKKNILKNTKKKKLFNWIQMKRFWIIHSLTYLFVIKLKPLSSKHEFWGTNNQENEMS